MKKTRLNLTKNLQPIPINKTNINRLNVSIPKVDRSKGIGLNNSIPQNINLTKELYNKALENIFNLSDFKNNFSTPVKNDENTYLRFKDNYLENKFKTEENELDPTISILNDSFGVRCARQTTTHQVGSGNSFLTNNNTSFNILCRDEEKQIGQNDSPSINTNTSNYISVSKNQLKRNVSQNSYDKDIEELFKDLDLVEYLENFRTNKIYFEDLILLSKEDLIELKLPLGPRNRLLKFIDDYHKEMMQIDSEEKNMNAIQEENVETHEKIKQSSTKRILIDPVPIYTTKINDNNIMKHSITSPYFSEHKLVFPTGNNENNTEINELSTTPISTPNCKSNKIEETVPLSNEKLKSESKSNLDWNTMKREEIANYQSTYNIEDLSEILNKSSLKKVTNVTISNLLIEKHNEIIKSRKNLKKEFVKLNDIVVLFNNQLREAKNKSVERINKITKILNRSQIAQKTSFYFHKNEIKTQEKTENTSENFQDLVNQPAEETRDLNEELNRTSKMNIEQDKINCSSQEISQIDFSKPRGSLNDIINDKEFELDKRGNENKILSLDSLSSKNPSQSIVNSS
jgi:hypothetical protein